MIKKIIRILYTLSYLKTRQVVYQIYYRLKKIIVKNYTPFKKTDDLAFPKRKPIIVPYNSNSYLEVLSFEFLNLKKEFHQKIDWNFAEYGKLWNYNLQYLDYINQEKISINEINYLLEDFTNAIKSGILVMEPYPVSLRLVNLVKYLMRTNQKDSKINQLINHHSAFLSKNLEYHLLANHLLENTFSLIVSSIYLNDKELFKHSQKIVIKQLDEQLLLDGGHYEQSPMYHCILLIRLLDTINIINSIEQNLFDNDFLDFLKIKASNMLGYLKAITFRNGDIPMVNDASPGIAFSTFTIFSYAEQLNIPIKNISLSQSGYRKYANSKFEIFADYGNILPSFQPGHAHSDHFNIIVYTNSNPFIVDTGTSTYQNNERRRIERSTFSHNTVSYQNMNQSDIWGAFRVGKRAKISNLKEAKYQIEASHDGYKNIGILHNRKIEYESNIIVSDSIIGNSNKSFLAFYHLHPDVIVLNVGNDFVSTNLGKLEFFNQTKWSIEEYKYALGFNLLTTAKLIKVEFLNKLTTVISA